MSINSLKKVYYFQNVLYMLSDFCVHEYSDYYVFFSLERNINQCHFFM